MNNPTHLALTSSLWNLQTIVDQTVILPYLVILIYQQIFALNIAQYFHNHASEPRLDIGVHAQNQQK